MSALSARDLPYLAEGVPLYLRGARASLTVRVVAVEGGHVRVCSAQTPSRAPGPDVLVRPEFLSRSRWPGLPVQAHPVLGRDCPHHPGHVMDLCPVAWHPGDAA